MRSDVNWKCVSVCIKLRLSPEPNPTLAFNALQRADRHLCFGMGNRDEAGLGGVAELLVTAGLANLFPTVRFDDLDDVLAAHVPFSA